MIAIPRRHEVTGTRHLIEPFGVCMHKGILSIWVEFRRHLATTIAAFGSRSVVSLLLMGCLVTIVAGPFGTFDTMDLARRAVHWGAIIACGLGIGALVNAALLTICRGWHPLGVDLAASLVVTTLLAPLILILRAGLDPSLTRADLTLGTIWPITLVFVAPVFFCGGSWSSPAPHRIRRARACCAACPSPCRTRASCASPGAITRSRW